VPFPYKFGIILLLLGLVASAFCPLSRWASGISIGFVISGLILCVQSITLPIYFSLASRYHHVNTLTQIVFWLIKAMGLNASWSQSSLFVQSDKQVFEFTTTIGKLGIYFWVNLLLGVLMTLWIWAPRKKSRWLAFLLLTSLIYLIFRYVALILLYLNLKQFSLFWNPWVTILTFAPLIFLLLKFIPLKEDLTENPLVLELPVITKKCLVLIGCSFVGAFLLIGAWVFQDSGEIKRGRILIDEKHSDWEWTTRKYDTDWYGEKSGYNYYCLADYLHYYYQVDTNFKPITAELLKNYDILIIKTPTSSFSSAEIESIRDFVKAGSGLFLIGDHTNVFGTSSYLNPLAQKFGLYFNYDATYDLKTGDLSVYRRPRMLPHPIVQRLPPFLFGTSCTLKVPLSADGVMIGYGLKTVYLDYSEKSFFSKETESTSVDFGLFIQHAAVKFGKGRVLAFTDSTVFSNFWMFIPGKPELFLGSIDWLNRKNRLHYLNFVFLALGFLSLSVAGFAISKTKIRDWLIFFFAISLAFPLSVYTFQTINRIGYPAPHPHTKYTSVCFESEHSNFDLPVLELVKDPTKSYHTFFVWTQRLGYIPQVSNSLEEALQKGDIVVIINPTKPFTAQERKQTLDYANQGGKIILMDSPLNKKSSANQLLRMFDMEIDYSLLENTAIYNASKEIIASNRQAGNIHGGKSILLTENNKSILSIVQKGGGAIVAMADSGLFSNSILGYVKNVPNEQQSKLSELEFWMLRELIQMPEKEVE